MSTAGCVPPELVGYGTSNTRVRVTGEQRVQLLNLQLPDSLGTRREGLATVHITAVPSPDGSTTPAAGSNGKLVAEVLWQAGSGGGQVEVDADHGMILSVGGATSIQANVRIESAASGVALSAGTTYTVEATVKWHTSGGCGPARLSLPSQVLDVEGLGVWTRIPRMARNLSLMCDNTAGYATLVSLLSRDTTTTAYETLTAPRLEPIVGGVEFFRPRGRAADTVTPVFELWA